MAHPIMSMDERHVFVSLASRRIAQKVPSPLVRMELGQRFGMSNKQVQNALTRAGLHLRQDNAGRRRLRDLTEKEQELLVAEAARMALEGHAREVICTRLAGMFNLYERSVTTRCLKNGIDLRSENTNSGPAVSGKPQPEEKPVIYESEPVAKGNLFAQAAAKVPGARYSYKTGECFLGRARVSGFELVRRAGMALPQ